MPDRDLSELTGGLIDIDAYWRKVSAGAEMKTAIKRFLTHYEAGKPLTNHAGRHRVQALRDALELWTNAG